jgi:hypothetical protein
LYAAAPWGPLGAFFFFPIVALRFDFWLDDNRFDFRDRGRLHFHYRSAVNVRWLWRINVFAGISWSTHGPAPYAVFF